MKLFEHEHPLNLVDLWSEQLQHEEEYDEDEEENDDALISKQDFRCFCLRCEEEINWYHRYYYTCNQLCSDYSIHKFCAELPQRLEDICEVGHILDFGKQYYYSLKCSFCYKSLKLSYSCYSCDIHVDANCVTKRLQKNIIHHPSHKHPLVCFSNQILDECVACGNKHKGIFYHCPMCVKSSFIHRDCAFLPQKLQIQHTTNDIFSHIHPLTLAYSFPRADQKKKKYPLCRVCRKSFYAKPNLWIYKCEKCRYYTHLDCATSRNEPFMSILKSPGTGKLIKNYEDDKHPYVVHLPFHDPSYSLLKHLFFKEDGYEVTKAHISHQHPLILKDAQCTDIISPTCSRIKSIAYHDPMKRIELLCNGCLRPIMSGPIYVCANDGEHCNFVLHEWCSRLPVERNDHPHHPQHTLILCFKVCSKFFGVFFCDLCHLPCNGFAYCCEECNYYIDVTCAFLPKEITHKSHPNHLLSLNANRYYCCKTCDYFSLSAEVFLIPEKTTHMCDKHPMKLSYFPIENHMGDYFCEICEDELNPNKTFYHCHECIQSMHTACAPSILQYETHTGDNLFRERIYQFVNVKFKGTYTNNKVHKHSLSFVQGIESDGKCHECEGRLQYRMIFKCLNCKFAIHYRCCESLK